MVRRTLLASITALLAACGAATVASPSADDPTSASPGSSHLLVDGDVEVWGGLLPPMPTAVTSFGAATDGTHVYVLGGYSGTPHAYSREGQSPSLLRMRLDGVGGWQELARLEAGVQGVALVAHQGAVCHVGGNRASNRTGEPASMQSVRDAGCFGEDPGAFTPLPDLPEGRSSHGAAVIDDTLFVAGGWRLEGGSADAEWLGTLLALDRSAGAAQSWRSIDAPFRRRAVGVAAAGGKLFVLGGLAPDGQMSREVDVYDPAAGSWSSAPSFPSDAFGIAATGSGNDVYASARDGVVYRLPVGGAAWEPVANLAFGRFFHQLVPAGSDALVVLGGIGGMHDDGRTRHVERVVLAPTAPRLAGFTAASPGIAKNRQGVVVHGEHLYLFGGNDSLEQHAFEPRNFVAEGVRMHLPSMRWERVTDFPVPRQTMQSVAQGDHAIFVGGFGHDGTAAVSHADAYAFDFRSREFSPRAGLPESRTQFGLAVYDEGLWVFGGLSYDPSRGGEAAFDHVRGVLRSSLAGDQPFAPVGVDLPGPRRAFAGAVLGDRYYLVGGMREGFTLVDDCFAFEFARREFQPIACPRAPRLSADLVALDGKLYLVGGSTLDASGAAPAASVEVYDPSVDAWDVIAELPMETRHMRALAHRGKVLLISTHDEQSRIHVGWIDPRLPGGGI